MTSIQPAPDGQIAIGAATHEGQRPNQEDAYGTSTFRTADGREALLALVADGIGGHQTGERASYLAKTVVPDELAVMAPASSEIPAAMARAFQSANQRIYDDAGTDPARAGMGTTCTAVAIVGNRLYLAHVGDSRAYLARGKALHQLSIDHTWAQEALAAGRSPEEIRVHPNRGVIKRYLGIDLTMQTDTRYQPWGAPSGTPPVDSAAHAFELQTGDCLLLCTDGVHDVLSDAEILATLRRYPAPVAAQRLVDQALRAGAQDNVTALVLDLPGVKKRAGLPMWVYPAIAAGLIVAVSAGVALARGGRERVALAPTEVGVTEIAQPEPTQATTAGPVTVTPLQETTTVAQPEGGTPMPAAAGTSTLVPTATLAPTHTPVPSRTPTPTHTATATPTPTPTLWPKPVLVSPEYDASVDQNLTLSWWLDGAIPDGHVFHLVVWRNNEGVCDERLPGTGFSLSLKQEGEYEWKVCLERQISEDRWEPASAESDVGRFRWEKSRPSGNDGDDDTDGGGGGNDDGGDGGGGADAPDKN